MKSQVKKRIFLFLFNFIFMAALFKFLNKSSWVSSIVTALVAYAFYVLIDYLVQFKEALYLKIDHYDEVLSQINKLGIKSFKEKGDITTYTLNNKRWPFNKIKLKKTPFYLYLEATPKVREDFLQFIS